MTDTPESNPPVPQPPARRPRVPQPQPTPKPQPVQETPAPEPVPEEPVAVPEEHAVPEPVTEQPAPEPVAAVPEPTPPARQAPPTRKPVPAAAAPEPAPTPEAPEPSTVTEMANELVPDEAQEPIPELAMTDSDEDVETAEVAPPTQPDVPPVEPTPATTPPPIRTPGEAPPKPEPTTPAPPTRRPVPPTRTPQPVPETTPEPEVDAEPEDEEYTPPGESSANLELPVAAKVTPADVKKPPVALPQELQEDDDDDDDDFIGLTKIAKKSKALVKYVRDNPEVLTARAVVPAGNGHVAPVDVQKIAEIVKAGIKVPPPPNPMEIPGIKLLVDFVDELGDTLRTLAETIVVRDGILAFRFPSQDGTTELQFKDKPNIEDIGMRRVRIPDEAKQPPTR